MLQPDLHQLLTVALLRFGADTHGARHLKAWLAGSREAPPVRWVAERLFEENADIPSTIVRASADAHRALAQATAHGFQAISVLDPDYPGLLIEIADPPPVLWVAGDPSVLARPAVGVVGSRSASPVSLTTARSLARDLAEAGLVVTSGLARGVDGAAHLGALDGGGPTVAVVGSGLDVVYPFEHRVLARRVASQGAVVTELPPGTRPLGWHFPLRNRIISGLSRAVVVIEASERSGSLITARMALEQGRDVLAVPGGTLSGRHRGCHRLIKDGARLVETVEDVLEEIGWSPAPMKTGDGPGTGPAGALEAAMAAGEAYSVDDLARQTGWSAPAVLAELGELELSGRVTRLGGGQFSRLAVAPRGTGE